MNNDNIIPEPERGARTEIIFDTTCFNEPADPFSADDVNKAIEQAVELDERPVFLEGLSERLNRLGIRCTADDTDIILKEMKNRYRNILGKSMPKAVRNWIGGTTPGLTNHINNYDICYALEMDFHQTAEFFQKHFLTLPWNCKNKTDAVFLWCLWHKKPYSAVQTMLEETKCFVSQENAHTSTSQILASIISENDEEKFLKYLSGHCYENEQQFQMARNIIKKKTETVKKIISEDEAYNVISKDRLNSLTIEAILGYRYQGSESPRNRKSLKKLPVRFRESLPNDVTLGKILNDEKASYETLRKTLILLKLFTFYYDAKNTDKNIIAQNLMDFYDELNLVLSDCGFARIYPAHPFDCLILYCANSYDPVLTLSYINEF